MNEYNKFNFFYLKICLFLLYGGHVQNRTGIKGFAILCVTIPPRGQKFANNKLFKSFICFIKGKSMILRSLYV